MLTAGISPSGNDCVLISCREEGGGVCQPPDGVKLERNRSGVHAAGVVGEPGME